MESDSTVEEHVIGDDFDKDQKKTIVDKIAVEDEDDIDEDFVFS